MVIALGIDLDGRPREALPSASSKRTSENATVLTPFLRSLVERGLDLSQGVLVILDGGKGLRTAVRKAFSPNRCPGPTGASGTSARTWSSHLAKHRAWRR